MKVDAVSLDTVVVLSAANSHIFHSLHHHNQVVVFSKSYCPFCTASKGLLQDLNIDFKAIELDEVPDGDAIQAALLELSAQRTVPNVFVKGQHLGGNDDTQAAAKSGKLQEMLK